MSLNEFGEKSQATIVRSKFVNKTYQTLIALQFSEMIVIGQKLKHVHITYYFLELLIFSWLTLAGTRCLEFISHYIKENLCKYLLKRK